MTTTSRDLAVEPFEREATAFLDASAPRRRARTEGPARWGRGSDSVALLEETSVEDQLTLLEAIRAWRSTEFDAGFGWLSGPVELGGAGRPVDVERSYVRMKRGYDLPAETMLGVSLGMVAAVIESHGTDELRRRYLERLHRVDIVASLLLSEPGAGSDLASLATRAVREGDEWRISGQKVWTSGAHLSDIGLVVCRTDPGAPQHEGMTAFVIDLRAPGVVVRPLRQMNGGSAFNEVFLDDVRATDLDRIGEVGGGWKVAVAALLHERSSIASGAASVGGAGFERVRDLARWCGRAGDPIVRQDLAALYTGLTVARATIRRHAAEGRANPISSVSGSIAKLMLVANQRRIGDLAGSLLGPALAADTGEWGTYAWADYLLSAPGIRIAGGTDEIQRNILSERGLGLPRAAG